MLLELMDEVPSSFRMRLLVVGRLPESLPTPLL